MAVATGDTATRRYVVTEEDSATALGSGDVPVLATPRLIAWCEAATVDAVASGLDAGATTVGVAIRVDHNAPTPIGVEVSVTATVASIDGRRLTYDVAVVDGNGTAADGTIDRVIVDRGRFIDRLSAGSG
ncbi:MAG: thioesterase family protein [Actinomycetota bacterium]